MGCQKSTSSAAVAGAGRGRRGDLCACVVGAVPTGVSVLIFMHFFLFSLLSAPPKFTKIPTDQIGVSGGVASFVCQATGSPKPVVYWNKKGKKVNSQRIEVVVTVHNG